MLLSILSCKCHSIIHKCQCILLVVRVSCCKDVFTTVSHLNTFPFLFVFFTNKNFHSFIHSSSSSSSSSSSRTYAHHMRRTAGS